MKQNGNVLFIILIAVALFAALSYTVAHSGRNQNPMDRETSKLNATRIISFGNRIKTAVDRLRISGCEPDWLDFGNDIWHRVGNTADYTVPVGHNPNAPADGSCNPFHYAGLGQPVVTFEKGVVPAELLANGAEMPGHGRVIIGAVSGIGTETWPELILQIGGLTESTCKAVNRVNGNLLETLTQDNPTDGVDFDDFTGTYPKPMPLMIGTGATAALAGRTEYCFLYSPTPWSSTGIYYYHKVLLER